MATAARHPLLFFLTEFFLPGPRPVLLCQAIVGLQLMLHPFKVHLYFKFWHQSNSTM